jgi:hypothetical protein
MPLFSLGRQGIFRFRPSLKWGGFHPSRCPYKFLLLVLYVWIFLPLELGLISPFEIEPTFPRGNRIEDFSGPKWIKNRGHRKKSSHHSILIENLHFVGLSAGEVFFLSHEIA